ncbi:hypothetical protein GLOTRDRAFT_92695 [Gloeophyllum trabeum ATCC 11539]|uniref:Ig-like domain-containing protein n=1 Tax=Gloeophyllum trabeum (strain ATCC 11539 / FP-39264 / Madison 617) TaxID=670483 RepID=S7Q9F7_GLOTA|nr:uncharacterized protein GLOTRDRAFT_92695 [Gloeophyllum trabeum ATCC 11539]EPQ56152.1 hypothetical protein GLOTRDRAFT_92695 [Gloeophyllum trabeum ATCC 11539]
MQFTILATLAAAAAVAVNAVPTADTPLAARAIEARSGCGSTGPLGDGHYIWWITVGCNSGGQYKCQAMGADGCLPGQTKHIGSMEVDVRTLVTVSDSQSDVPFQDPNDTTQYAKQSNTNSVTFTCPSGGQIRCQANFNDNNDGPNYSLRVIVPVLYSG